MSQSDPSSLVPSVPNLVKAEDDPAASAAAAPEIRRAGTFTVEVSRIVKDKDERALTLVQVELAELSAACGWLKLSSDTASYQSRRGGIIAGLLRVMQRLESTEKPG